MELVRWVFFSQSHIHTCRSRRRKVVGRSEILPIMCAKRPRNFLGLPIAQKIKRPAGRVPYDVGAQSPIERSDATLMTGDVTDDSE